MIDGNEVCKTVEVGIGDWFDLQNDSRFTEFNMASVPCQHR